MQFPTRPVGMTAERTDSFWRPVLDGPEAEHALGVAREIVDALRDPTLEVEDDPSLASGRAGLALLHAFGARSGVAPHGEEDCARFLDAAVDALASIPLPTGLYSGFTGVAWTVELLAGSAEKEDANEMIDEAVLEHVGTSPWRTHYDLISGPVGIGVYALERLPRPAAVAALEEIVSRLEERAERRDGGTTWHTEWNLLPEHMRGGYGGGHYNLGVAHGVPGVVALLGRICEAGVARERARPLLDGAVRWLLAQELPQGALSCFPFCVAEGVEPGPSRAAWCYGDPGLAAALLCAARAVGEKAWEREALRIARETARRVPERAGVVDAGVCHGAAGLALIYARIYNQTGDEELREAARFWALRTLELRKPGEGVSGYLAWGPPRRGGPSAWQADPGLLTGAAGVALTLMAAATETDPEWDRFLLVSR